MQAIKPMNVSKEESMVLIKNMVRRYYQLRREPTNDMHVRFVYQSLQFVIFEIFSQMNVSKRNNMVRLKFINYKEA